MLDDEEDDEDEGGHDQFQNMDEESFETFESSIKAIDDDGHEPSKGSEGPCPQLLSRNGYPFRVRRPSYTYTTTTQHWILRRDGRLFYLSHDPVSNRIQRL